LSREYLREFSKKFEMAVMVYSDAWGKLIHEKNRSRKSHDTVPLIKATYSPAVGKLVNFRVKILSIGYEIKMFYTVLWRKAFTRATFQLLSSYFHVTQVR
jgi:hypothetical protein